MRRLSPPYQPPYPPGVSANTNEMINEDKGTFQKRFSGFCPLRCKMEEVGKNMETTHFKKGFPKHDTQGKKRPPILLYRVLLTQKVKGSNKQCNPKSPCIYYMCRALNTKTECCSHCKSRGGNVKEKNLCVVLFHEISAKKDIFNVCLINQHHPRKARTSPRQHMEKIERL